MMSKKMLVLLFPGAFFFALMGFICDTRVKTLKESLNGVWIYQYSFFNEKKSRLITNKHCPTFKMMFSECEDKHELNGMPKEVKHLRDRNALKNLKCVTFDEENEKIDTYYPIANFSKDTGSRVISINNYGTLYKSEYFIDNLNNDTLVIFDEKNYDFDNKEYLFVRHLYIKIK